VRLILKILEPLFDFVNVTLNFIKPEPCGLMYIPSWQACFVDKAHHLRHNETTNLAPTTPLREGLYEGGFVEEKPRPGVPRITPPVFSDLEQWTHD
jgi:hypothetical protein